MHYFIDGYNLLFRLKHSAQENLQAHREAFIQDLNQKVSLLGWEVSIVFDAPFQAGDRTRTHFAQLEILYTAYGETADEYIVEELKQATHPRQETVVTSDKKLAWLARSLSAHTESIEAFLTKLQHAYKKKLRHSGPSKEKERRLSSPSPPPPSPPPSPHMFEDPTLERYYQLFEAEWQSSLQHQKSHQDQRKAAKNQRRACPPRQPRAKSDPFSSNLPSEPDGKNEMDRWLKLFERSPEE